MKTIFSLLKLTLLTLYYLQLLSSCDLRNCTICSKPGKGETISVTEKWLVTKNMSEIR